MAEQLIPDLLLHTLGDGNHDTVEEEGADKPHQIEHTQLDSERSAVLKKSGFAMETRGTI